MVSSTASHQLGRQAENRAMGYLQKKGFAIKARNYRFQRSEIDIIAQKEDLLLFVEIKVRTYSSFGYPESFFHSKQQERYLLAANEYIQDSGWSGQVRFDVIAYYKKQKKMYLSHFKDVFF